MFGDKIGESCSTAGTSTYQLGGAYGAWRTWSSAFSNSDPVFYYATNSTGSIWELGYGVFSTGSPQTITRTLLASSTGSLIVWSGTYYIFSAPVALVLKHLFAPLINGVASVPGWLAAGAKWWDYTLGLATAWIKKTYISGTRTTATSHAEEGRTYIGLSGGAPNIHTPSPRHYWVDKGANNYTIAADDIGKVLEFDVTSANRVPTLPAISSVGHGFAVGLRGYGSATNSLTLTPNGTDAIDALSASATKSLLGELPVVWVEVDGARSKWVTSYAAPAAVAATQAEQEAGSSTAAFVTPGRQQYHPSAAKAWLMTTVSGGTPTATVSYNVSSITDSGTGDGIINFTTAFSSASYAWQGGGTMQASVRWINVWRNRDRTTSASAFPFYTTNNSAAIVDGDEWALSFFGDQ